MSMVHISRGRKGPRLGRIYAPSARFFAGRALATVTDEAGAWRKRRRHTTRIPTRWRR